MPPRTIFFAGYVGSNARHVETAINANATAQIAPPTTALSSIAFFKTISTGGNFVERAGQNDYNSLQFGVERRFSSGLSFMANMTWSKCLGDIRDLLDNGIGSYRAPYVPGVGIAADYTLCTIDVRRIVHTSGTYDLPFGRGRAIPARRRRLVDRRRMVDELDLYGSGWPTVQRRLHDQQPLRDWDAMH